MNKLKEFVETSLNKKIDRMEQLPVSGSARSYFRVFTEDETYIALEHTSLQENGLFLDFSKRFANIGLSVPKIYAISDDKLSYIQEDLGDTMLLNIVNEDRDGDRLGYKTIELYKKSLKELTRFQFLGHKVVDYDDCIPRPVFDKRAMMWDLHYFKYCFLLLSGNVCNEDALENDFEHLLNRICNVDTNAFMFRDFQSRNIMIKDHLPVFVDYQGGRQGALHYDVASLLYDPIVDMPNEQREELLDFYLHEIKSYKIVDDLKFKVEFCHFALLRLLQALGAFGLRGLHEKKQHFIDSISPGLKITSLLLEHNHIVGCYPELERVIKVSVKNFC